MRAAEARAIVRRSLLLDPPAGLTAASQTAPQPDPATPVTCCIGAFDGLHRGHQALVAATVADARARGGQAVAVTFDPDPSDLLSPGHAQPHLLSCADRARALRACGADRVVTLPFTEDLAHTPQEDFLDRWLLAGLNVASIHVGANFRYGDRGAGDVASLGQEAMACGIAVEAHPLEQAGGQPVSATRVRSLLAQGQVGEAEALLGRSHFVRGRVEHGRGEGTGMGFPTANVRVPASSCLPGEGVYAGWLVDGGTAWPAAINVGAPRTFADRPDDHFLEASLVGFAGDLYGHEVTVTFWRWLRAARRFDSLEELERVVLANVDWVRTNLGQEGVEVGA